MLGSLHDPSLSLSLCVSVSVWRGRRFSPNIHSHSPVLVSPASRRSSKPSPISVLSIFSTGGVLLLAAAADNRGTLNPKKAME